MSVSYKKLWKLLIDKDMKKTGLSESEIVHEIFRVAASSYEMSEYIKDIEEWLLSTKEAMKP